MRADPANTARSAPMQDTANLDRLIGTELRTAFFVAHIPQRAYAEWPVSNISSVCFSRASK